MAKLIDGKTAISLESLIRYRASARKAIIGQQGRSRSQSGGQHQSFFKGKGMEHEDSRLYQAGDDIRHIDWKVTARTGKAHSKQYIDERERDLFFLLDFGPSMRFGTINSTKAVLAGKISSLFAWASLAHHDRIHGYLAHEHKSHELRTGKGKRAILAMLKEISQDHNFLLNASGDGDYFGKAITKLCNRISPGGIVIIISDFLHFNQQQQNQLTRHLRNSTAILIQIEDPMESDVPVSFPFKLGFGSNQKKITPELSLSIKQGFKTHCQHIQKYATQNGCLYERVSTETNDVALVKQLAYIAKRLSSKR